MRVRSTVLVLMLVIGPFGAIAVSEAEAARAVPRCRTLEVPALWACSPEELTRVLPPPPGVPQTITISWTPSEGWDYKKTDGLHLCVSLMPAIIGGFGEASVSCTIKKRLPTGYYCQNAALAAAIVATSPATLWGEIDCGGLEGACLADTHPGLSQPACATSVFGESTESRFRCSASVRSPSGTGALRSLTVTCNSDP